MKNKAIILITFVFIFITSCDDKDQITGDVIEPDLPVYIQTDMSGYDGGDSEHLGNLYYNFLSNDSYNHEFYKFNNYHLSGGNHSPAEDLLTLKTYQSVYYVPASSIFDPYSCIDISIDCGITWDSLYGAYGTDLQTEPYVGSAWYPTCGSWKKDTLNLSNFGLVSH